MNTKAQNEKTAQAALSTVVIEPEQILSTLPPAERAAVVLKLAEREIEFAELAKKSSDIASVSNKDGRDQLHAMGMVLKNARVGITKEGKISREDANDFCSEVIAVEKKLIGLIEPEEKRVFKLRDEWDEKEESERQARIDAEAARRAAIEAAIAEIRQFEIDASRLRTAEEIKAKITCLENTEITTKKYQERHTEAFSVKISALEVMWKTHDAQKQKEQAEIEAARAIKEEQERIALANAALQAEKAAHDAKMAEERAELARQAAAQKVAIDAKKAELQRQLDALAEAKAQAEVEASRLQAEKDAKAAAEAKAIADELDRVEAEERAKAEAIAAEESSEFSNELVKSWVDSGDATKEKPESVNLQLIREIADVLSMDVIAAIDTLRNYPYDDVLAELAAQEAEK